MKELLPIQGNHNDLPYSLFQMIWICINHVAACIVLCWRTCGRSCEPSRLHISWGPWECSLFSCSSIGAWLGVSGGSNNHQWADCHSWDPFKGFLDIGAQISPSPSIFSLTPINLSELFWGLWFTDLAAGLFLPKIKIPSSQFTLWGSKNINLDATCVFFRKYTLRLSTESYSQKCFQA